jgi:hypothetical protein
MQRWGLLTVCMTTAWRKMQTRSKRKLAGPARHPRNSGARRPFWILMSSVTRTRAEKFRVSWKIARLFFTDGVECGRYSQPNAGRRDEQAKDKEPTDAVSNRKILDITCRCAEAQRATDEHRPRIEGRSGQTEDSQPQDVRWDGHRSLLRARREGIREGLQTKRKTSSIGSL